MKRYTVLLLFIIFCRTTLAQNYKYIDSSKIMRRKSYLKEIKAEPDSRLVEIKKYISPIVLDIRYATTNNFMHRRMYTQAKAFARLPVVEALMLIEADLKTRGLGLKIYDAYRPYAVTVKFYEMAHDTNFVADPRKGSRHNRGCAVDLTLISLKTGGELEMPTGFDSFSVKAAANYPDLPKNKIANRELLKSIMEAHGFKVYRSEWWHYDFYGWQNYPLLDVPFSEISE